MMGFLQNRTQPSRTKGETRAMKRIESMPQINPSSARPRDDADTSPTSPINTAVMRSNSAPPGYDSAWSAALRPVPKKSVDDIEESSHAPRQPQLPLTSSTTQFLDLPQSMHQELAKRMPASSLATMQLLHRSLAQEDSPYRTEIQSLHRRAISLQGLTDDIFLIDEWSAQLGALGLQTQPDDDNGDASSSIQRLPSSFRAGEIAHLIDLLINHLYGNPALAMNADGRRQLIQAALDSLDDQHRDLPTSVYIQALTRANHFEMEGQQVMLNLNEITSRLESLAPHHRERSLGAALAMDLSPVWNTEHAPILARWVRLLSEDPDPHRRMNFLQSAFQQWRQCVSLHSETISTWRQVGEMLIQSLIRTAQQRPIEHVGAELLLALSQTVGGRDYALGSSAMLWNLWQRLPHDPTSQLVTLMHDMRSGSARTGLLRIVLTHLQNTLTPSSWPMVAQMVMQSSLRDREGLLALLPPDWTSMPPAQRLALHDAARQNLLSSTSASSSTSTHAHTSTAGGWSAEARESSLHRIRLGGTQSLNEPYVGERLAQWRSWVDTVASANHLPVTARLELLMGLLGRLQHVTSTVTASAQLVLHPHADDDLVQAIAVAMHHLSASLPPHVRAHELGLVAERLHQRTQSPHFHPTLAVAISQHLVAQLPSLLHGRPTAELDRSEAQLNGSASLSPQAPAHWRFHLQNLGRSSRWPQAEQHRILELLQAHAEENLNQAPTSAEDRDVLRRFAQGASGVQAWRDRTG